MIRSIFFNLVKSSVFPVSSPRRLLLQSSVLQGVWDSWWEEGSRQWCLFSLLRDLPVLAFLSSLPHPILRDYTVNCCSLSALEDFKAEEEKDCNFVIDLLRICLDFLRPGCSVILVLCIQC